MARVLRYSRAEFLLHLHRCAFGTAVNGGWKGGIVALGEIVRGAIRDTGRTLGWKSQEQEREREEGLEREDDQRKENVEDGIWTKRKKRHKPRRKRVGGLELYRKDEEEREAGWIKGWKKKGKDESRWGGGEGRMVVIKRQRKRKGRRWS